MAVDFSLLPTKETSQISAPSRFAWTVTFFLMVLAGVFITLFLWPKGTPTQTPTFWTCLTLFPVGIPAWIVLRRYSVYEGRKLDAALSDEAVQDFNDRVCAAASIPLALVGAAHRFSSDSKKNDAAQIKQGALTLEIQDPIADDGDPVKARWLVIPGMSSTSGRTEDDRKRHLLLTAWLYGELLDDLLPRIHAMAAQVPLTICLSTSNGLTREENENLWLDCWRERSLEPAELAPATQTPADLMQLDSWLDEVLANTSLFATLFVAVQLQPLLDATPPADTAEAGAAVLLLPDALALRHRVPRIASLHRPVQGPLDQPEDALSHALRWAGVEPASITGGWQTGLNAEQAGALREPAKKLGLSAHGTDLDQTVGYAGAAAPWLALACAASWLSHDRTAQLLLVGHEKQVHGAVLKPAGDATTARGSPDASAGDTVTEHHAPAPSITHTPRVAP